MAKHREHDTEMQMYVEECMRLRTILEQTMVQTDAFAQQQQHCSMTEQIHSDEQVRLQNALFQQEVELNNERQVKTHLEEAYISE